MSSTEVFLANVPDEPRTQKNVRARVPVDTCSHHKLFRLIESQIRIQRATMQQHLAHRPIAS